MSTLARHAGNFMALLTVQYHKDVPLFSFILPAIIIGEK